MTNDQRPQLFAYLDAGLSFVPIHRDGSKAPAVPAWTPYTEAQPTRAEVERWIAAGHEGWALICGAISGNVEVLDFDDPDLFQPWSEQIDDALRLFLGLDIE